MAQLPAASGPDRLDRPDCFLPPDFARTTMADNTSGPDNNVFTVLAFIALLILLAGVGYTWFRFNEVFGTWNPFG
jgi:hypothetical protein